MKAMETRRLDHLGLVAGMFDRLKIGEVIDALLPQHACQAVSHGTRVKAMVLNSLGFPNRTLYLTPQFFAGKSMERLFGGGLSESSLNDDALGRTLDALHEAGVERVFLAVSQRAVELLGRSDRFVSMDATSFSLEGSYEKGDGSGSKEVLVCFGHSKEGRSDLKQICLTLIVSQKTRIPLMMARGAGNQSEARVYGEVIKDFVKQFQDFPSHEYIVADASFYNARNLAQMASDGTGWISRVPRTLQMYKNLCRAVDWEKFVPVGAGYLQQSFCVTYGGVEQRWMLVFSESLMASHTHRYQKQWMAESLRVCKEVSKLEKQTFHCREDALCASQAYASWIMSVEVIEIAHYGPGKRTATTAVDHYTYQLSITLASNLSEYKKDPGEKGFFVIATSEMDEGRLSPGDLLSAYKGQDQVEKGFRFLKDPMFMADTFFVKKQERIVALLLIMVLTLLVYASLELLIRTGLSLMGKTFPDQKGKATHRPTARWVFFCFTGIEVLCNGPPEMDSCVLNLRDHHLTILEILGKDFKDVYT